MVEILYDTNSDTVSVERVILSFEILIKIILIVIRYSITN